MGRVIRGAGKDTAGFGGGGTAAPPADMLPLLRLRAPPPPSPPPPASRLRLPGLAAAAAAAAAAPVPGPVPAAAAEPFTAISSWAGGGGSLSPSPGEAAPFSVAGLGRCGRIFFTQRAEHPTWRCGRLQQSGRTAARSFRPFSEGLGRPRVESSLGYFRRLRAAGVLRERSGASSAAVRERRRS